MNSKYLTLPLLATSAVILMSARNLKPAYESPRGLEGRQSATSPETGNQFHFKDDSGGSGIAKNGNHFSFHDYTSGDGVKVLTYIELCPSAKLAKRALDQKIKEASSITARGPKLGKSGEPIGERVVLAVENYQGERESESFICWTTGSRFHWIQSKSLRHALAFEKTLDP